MAAIWRPTRNTWASEGSVSRNKQPIADAFRTFVRTQSTMPRNILEIASGFGDHVSLLALENPEIQFQPTEAQEECVAQLRAISKSNVNAPRTLNVLSESDWRDLQDLQIMYEGIVNINMIHISHQDATECLFRGARTVLQPGGFLMLYGAYLLEDGSFASPSDEAFDRDLKTRDSSFGLRNPLKVDSIARQHGFHRISAQNMALNNKLYIWQLKQD